MKKLNQIIKKVLMEHVDLPMSLVEKVKVSKEMEYHLDNKISLSENIFRIYSEKYFDLINEARELYNKNLLRLNEEDSWLVESDLGKKVVLENGNEVYLDAPMCLCVSIILLSGY